MNSADPTVATAIGQPPTSTADPTVATTIGQPPTSTADPTISASQGPDTSTGTQGGTPIQDFITHAVNQATFQLPEGIAKGTPVAKRINSLLGNLPSSLIDSAGGKQKLLDTLNRNSTAGTVGDIAGLFGPGGIEGKLGKTLGKAALVGAGEQGARSLITGDKNIGQSMALGAAGGGLGYGIGKGVGKLLGSAASDPASALAEITNTAKKTYLANTIPDLSTRDFKKWVSRGIGGAGEVGAPEAARSEIGEVFSAIRENGLENKLAQDAFRKRSQPDGRLLMKPSKVRD